MHQPRIEIAGAICFVAIYLLYKYAEALGGSSRTHKSRSRGGRRIITGVSFAQLSAHCVRHGSHEMADITNAVRARIPHARHPLYRYGTKNDVTQSDLLSSLIYTSRASGY